MPSGLPDDWEQGYSEEWNTTLSGALARHTAQRAPEQEGWLLGRVHRAHQGRGPEKLYTVAPQAIDWVPEAVSMPRTDSAGRIARTDSLAEETSPTK
eukprot:gene54351-62593_t